MVKDWDKAAQFKLPVIILYNAEKELRETRCTSSTKEVGRYHLSAQRWVRKIEAELGFARPS
jgi:hypothetical protein|tara:strand:- start:70 stop:255 length:186 start_codon:yes stop_codon:yes gene_type:complete